MFIGENILPEPVQTADKKNVLVDLWQRFSEEKQDLLKALKGILVVYKGSFCYADESPADLLPLVFLKSKNDILQTLSMTNP